jgi:hypothetical protein
MPTVSDFENARAAIVFAFAEALHTIRANEAKGDSDDGEALETAFAVARSYGWDYEQNADFTAWCLKATEQEICTAGLVKALEGVRLP